MRRTLYSLLIIVALAIPALSVSAQAVRYEITDLIKAHEVEFEDLGAGAYAIADDSVIAGFTGQSRTKSAPFYTIDGKPTRVKTGKYGATFSDINNAGVIVGRTVTSRRANGSAVGLPAYWVNGKITRLELPPNIRDTLPVTGAARAINDDGLIIGDIQYPGERNQSVVVWRDLTPIVLPSAFSFPYCQAHGFSESGLIGGHCWHPTLGLFQPVVWDDYEAIPLQGLTNLSSEIWSIVDTAAGGFVAAGFSYHETGGLPPDVVPVLYMDGVAESLNVPAETPYCNAFAVSATAHGILVGGTCAATTDILLNGWAEHIAVAWLDSELIDLAAAIPDDSGWTLLSVRAVNSSGQMVGLGERNGIRRSFLLTPTG